MKEKESFLDALIPEPDHVHSRRRVASTSILVGFFLVILWLACKFSGESMQSVGSIYENAWLGSWIYQTAPWQTDDRDIYLGSTSSNPESTSALDEQSTADVETAQKSKVDLGKYVWHSDLESWDDTSEKGGRLIVIGDVHGMLESLK